MDEAAFNVHSSSIVDLKAELYRKQESFRQVKLSRDQRLADDDGDLYLNRAVNNKYKLGKRIRDKATKKPDQGQKRELSEKEIEERVEEEKALKKSREMLEKKARIYEEKLRNVNIRVGSDDEEDDEDAPLVNFEQKAIDEMLKKRNEKRKANDENVERTDDVVNEEPIDEGDWVEFTDSLGRSRRCLKKDLDTYKEIDQKYIRARKTSEPSQVDSFAKLSRDNEMLTSDLKRELDRREWEQDQMKAMEDQQTATDQGPTHYQNVQYNEVRDHGVGYYSFSADDQKRQEQMRMLNELRASTVNQKEARQKLKQRRKNQMRQRLAKIAQRKGIPLELPPSWSDSDEGDQEDDEDDQKEAEPEPIRRVPDKMREWDIGKSSVDVDDRRFIDEDDHRRPTPTRLRSGDYIKQLRDERNDEFAPPSSYFIDKKNKNWNTTNANVNKFSRSDKDDGRRFMHSSTDYKGTASGSGSSSNANSSSASPSSTTTSLPTTTESTSSIPTFTSPSSSSRTLGSESNLNMIADALSFFRRQAN